MPRLSATQRDLLLAIAGESVGSELSPQNVTASCLIAKGCVTKPDGQLWQITDEGREALRTPYLTQAEANRHAGDWRRGKPLRVLGWHVLPCRGGGFAVRVGIAGQPSVLLPEGVDKGLVK